MPEWRKIFEAEDSDSGGEFDFPGSILGERKQSAGMVRDFIEVKLDRHASLFIKFRPAGQVVPRSYTVTGRRPPPG